MGKSFILKDRSGAAAGYISMGFGVLRCRMTGAKTGMEAVLLHADGSCTSRPMDTTDAEQTWETAESAMTGAAIVADGWIIADTGCQAREHVRRMIDAGKKKEKQDKTGEPEKRRTDAPLQSGGKEQCHIQAEYPWETEGQGTEKAEGLPQRRWPRPPCMQAAIYRDGKWMEEGQ